MKQKRRKWRKNSTEKQPTKIAQKNTREKKQ